MAYLFSDSHLIYRFVSRTLSHNLSSPIHHLSRARQNVWWSAGTRTCGGKDLVHRRPERGCLEEIAIGCQRYARRPDQRLRPQTCRHWKTTGLHTTRRGGISTHHSTDQVQISTIPVPPSKSLSMRTLWHTPSTVSDLEYLSMSPSAIPQPRSSVRRSNSLSASRLLVYKPWPTQTASWPPRGHVPKPV